MRRPALEDRPARGSRIAARYPRRRTSTTATAPTCCAGRDERGGRAAEFEKGSRSTGTRLARLEFADELLRTASTPRPALRRAGRELAPGLFAPTTLWRAVFESGQGGEGGPRSSRRRCASPRERHARATWAGAYAGPAAPRTPSASRRRLRRLEAAQGRPRGPRWPGAGPAARGGESHEIPARRRRRRPGWPRPPRPRRRARRGPGAGPEPPEELGEASSGWTPRSCCSTWSLATRRGGPSATSGRRRSRSTRTACGRRRATSVSSTRAPSGRPSRMPPRARRRRRRPRRLRAVRSPGRAATSTS